MAALTIFPVYQWTSGQTMTAVLLNNPLSAIQAWSTTIDNTNLAGGTGIYASQIVPVDSASATFGGSIGYTFTAPSVGVSPLTVNGMVGQTANILTVNAAASGAFTINAIGAATFGGRLGFAPTLSQTLGAGAPQIGNDLAAVNGLAFTVPNTSTNGYQFWAGGTAGTKIAGLTAAGALSVLGGGATLGFLPPVYTAAGAALAATTHIATGTAGFSGVSTSVVTLTGAAIFASASYQVVATTIAASGASVVSIVNSSGSQFTITLSAAATGSVNWIAIGA